MTLDTDERTSNIQSNLLGAQLSGSNPASSFFLANHLCEDHYNKDEEMGDANGSEVIHNSMHPNALHSGSNEEEVSSDSDQYLDPDSDIEDSEDVCSEDLDSGIDSDNSDLEDMNTDKSDSDEDNGKDHSEKFDSSSQFSFRVYQQLWLGRNRVPLKAKEFIKKSIYKEVLLGKVDLDFDVPAKNRSKGPMNAVEKSLFDHVNTILQTPVCVQYAESRANSISLYYSTFAIAKYISYMASKGFTKDTFKVDGTYLADFIEEWIKNQRIDPIHEARNYHASTYRFTSAMKILYELMGLDEGRGCRNENEFQEFLSKLRYVPEIYKVDRLIAERKERVKPKWTFIDKESWLSSSYTKENVKLMMQYRLNQTGKSNKKDIYDGINGKLEFLLGDHYLFRSQYKCSLELSESIWDHEKIDGQNVRVLGFQAPPNHSLFDDNIYHNNSASSFRVAGAIRHKDVHLCFISIFAMSIWYRFDFAHAFAPFVGKNFPDFLNQKDWQSIKVLLSTKKLGKTNISRRDILTLGAETIMKSRFTTLYKILDRDFGKMQLAEAIGVECIQIGRSALYFELQNKQVASFPVDLLKVSAGFITDELYCIERDIYVPEKLQKKVFPWLEDALEMVASRTDQFGFPHLKRDAAVGPFLNMLKDLRSIIIQDLAILHDENPSSNVFTQHPITKDAMFIEFKTHLYRS